MTDYLIYDVFTDAAFGGNPLAVIPDAAGLTEVLFPVIAREFNLSETVFVLPPDDPAHTARLRIFTPAVELPFAGHPLVGTAVALSDLGRGGSMTLELGVGPIAAEAADGRGRFVTRVPLSIGQSYGAGEIAACLGLGRGEVLSEPHPPVEAGLGTPFVLAEIASVAALGRASPDLAAFRRLARGSTAALRLAVMAYVRDGPDLRARMFAPLGGVVEDPATGSAAAALAAFLAEQNEVGGALRIRQGIEMGRPSLIETEVTLTGGRATAVAVAGGAVRIAEGRLILP